MKKQIGKMLGGMKSLQRTRRSPDRKLRMELLEGRRLLAADFNLHHNPLIDMDVIPNQSITPADALAVINELNRNGSHSLVGHDPQGLYMDVNNDGYVSPADVLKIVNFLNKPDGEISPLVTYTSQVTNPTTGAPITQVVVGQTFRLNVFVADTRPTGPTGVFQNALDVGVEGSSNITFPTGSGSFVSNLKFGDTYKNGPRGTRGAAGNEAEDFFNEVTSFATSTTPPDPAGGTYLFFSADILASTAGDVKFLLNKHENEPTSQVNVFDESQTLPDNGRIDPSMIMYGMSSITIITDPTAPVAMNDTVTTREDTSILLVGGTVDLTTNDARETGRTLTVVSISSIAGTTQGTLNGFTYTPPANVFGTSDVVTYTVEDNTGLRSSATVTISITAVNDPPDAVNDAPTVDEMTTGNMLDVLANDSPGPGEAASDSLTITSVGTPDSGGTVSIAADGKSLVYSPLSTFLGTETFTYTITDSGGLTDTATVTVEVVATVLPRALTDRPTVVEDSMNNVIDVLLNDRFNAGATKFLVGIATQPTNGSVSIDDNGTSGDASDDKILYTPNANFFGTDTFTYTMNDTANGSVASTGTVVVTVTGVNDPVMLVDDTVSATEDTVATIAISTLLANDSPGANEASTQTLSVTGVTAVGAGGTVAIVGTNVIYTPTADFNGTFLFTYTAQDNGSPISSGTATVTVNVAAVNDNPIANPDTVSATEDTPAMFAASTLTSNDSPGPANESGQTLSVMAVSASSTAGGTVVLAGGNITYTPPLNFNGADTFTYTLSDGAGGTATGTVTVNVAPVNDAPIAGNDTARAFKDIPLTIQVATLLANDSPGPANESGQTLSITAVTPGADINGTVMLNANGTITYTPNMGYTGPASFTYTLQDSGPSGNGNVNTATGTVNITVEEFVPTTISGTVWMDENNDGLIDNTGPRVERRLEGIKVTITGMSLGQAITPQTVSTLADGSYAFEDLGPGRYVVNFHNSAYLIDGKDVPGVLGDMDSVENQFTIDIAQPGGADGSQNNFAVLGIQSTRARIIDQLASRYTAANPTYAYNGAFFVLGADNTMKWGSLLDGFSGVTFAEAVLSDDGKDLLLTIVDSSNNISTAKLSSVPGRAEFLALKDSNGDTLIRVLGEKSEFAFQRVDLSTPAIVSAKKYLDAVDAIFNQEGWK